MDTEQSFLSRAAHFSEFAVCQHLKRSLVAAHIQNIGDLQLVHILDLRIVPVVSIAPDLANILFCNREAIRTPAQPTDNKLMLSWGAFDGGNGEK